MIRIDEVPWKTVRLAVREGESLGVKGGQFLFASPWEGGFEPLVEAELIHAALAYRRPDATDEFTVVVVADADEETLVYADPSVHVIVIEDAGAVLGPLEDGTRREFSFVDEDEDGEEDDEDEDE